MKTMLLRVLIGWGILWLFLTPGMVGAAQPAEGEEALFTTSVAPDALIVLDLSGSMDWNPAGGSNIWGNSSCSGTFYSSSGTGHTVNCSRVAIAKRAIFDILDDNDSNRIDGSDETSLGVRIGYMRFYDASSDDTGGSYSSGSNKLIRAINTKYSLIYCASNNYCDITTGSSSSSCVNGESANGGTPLVAALNEARLYLNAHKALDNAATCRQKFAILISDGADTFSCGGNGTETQADMYKRRRETVAKAKALADAGYRTFVIGFGSGMPAYLQNTLNWAAYYGGTDNPDEPNTGGTSDYNPSSVTSCAAATTTGTCNGTSTNCFAASNDPGSAALSGYAFLASDADQLAASLKAAINIIREATYSFSQASIQSSRTQDENYIYEGSFQPVTGDPFWLGHFKKYAVNNDGTVGSVLWDAGMLLRDRTASSRTIYTHKTGITGASGLIAFNTTNITAADLAVATTTARDAVVGYFRGESAYNPDNWKLGDVFRATPITVGTPSAYFDDMRDASGPPNAFAQHRSNHVRSSTGANPQRILLAGANDGQLHAFLASDGSETWSFIPPNHLPRLKLIAHSTEPTALAHQYYVDGPVTVADVWIPAAAAAGTTKSAADWYTLAVFGEGRGGSTTLWSSSPSCDTGFSSAYSATNKYYCGYYALDLNSSLAPNFRWILGGNGASDGFTASTGPYMGAPWSKMMTGRVLIGGNERWVGFVGGGVYTSGSSHSGKGFFVVDLYDGKILWSYTRADNSDLDNPMPASPAIVDTDNDGLVDTVYIGDLGSNMWRFKFCLNADGATCGTANWTGGRLFQANSSSGNRPIYTSAAVAKGSLWIYWGTGDKTDPTSPSAQEKFFGLKDDDRTATYTISDLENITSAGGSYSDSSKVGYYINLAGQGEKMLADPTVFGGVVYFTTFTPPSGTNPCEQGGNAKLYGLNFRTGGGALPIGSDPANRPRSMDVGTGIASAPVISLKPGGGTTPDLYVTTSGGGGIGSQTQRVNITPPGLANRTNILFWKDRRVD
jgi:Tfp pilus tip-associated adhesin PilY1